MLWGTLSIILTCAARGDFAGLFTAAILGGTVGVVAFIYVLLASICFLGILTESANGFDQMPSWPGTEIFDRLLNVLYFVNSLALCVLVGLPIDAQEEFTGNFFTLLTPYGVWMGVTGTPCQSIG